VGVDGLPKTGKTRFGLTFPGPHVIIDYDHRVEHLVSQFPDKTFVWDEDKPLGPLAPNEVRVIPVFFDELENNYRDARRQFDRLKSKWVEAVALLAQAGQGTLMPDTDGQMWQHISFVKATEAAGGEPKDVQPRHYGEANRVYRNFIQMPKKHRNINLVLTHHMTGDWGMVVDERGRSRLGPTGEFRVQQQSQVRAMVDLVILLEKVGAGSDVRHIATIEECGDDTGLIGTQMVSGTKLPPTYDTLVKLLGGD